MTAIAIIIGWICVSVCIMIVGADITKAINDAAASTAVELQELSGEINRKYFR